MTHLHLQQRFVVVSFLLPDVAIVDPNHFDPILINVTIKAVPKDPAMTRPKFIMAVPWEMFLFSNALIPAVLIGIINKETANILIAYIIIKYI